MGSPLRTIIRIGTGFVGLAILSACNYTHSKVSPLEGATWFQRVQYNVINPHCAKCHSGAESSAGFDFSSYESLMKTGSIMPFKPEESAFLMSMRKGRMPKGMAPVPGEMIDSVQTWIEAGAPIDNPKPPPPPKDPEPNYAWLNANTFLPKCIGCHNRKDHKGDFNMENYEVMMESGNISAGSPEDSRFWRKIDNGEMPPKENPQLTNKEKSAIFKWISDGATK